MAVRSRKTSRTSKPTTRTKRASPAGAKSNSLTVKQVATRCRCSVATVRSAISSGKLKAKKVGSSWQCSPTAVDTWTNARKKAASSSKTTARRTRARKKTTTRARKTTARKTTARKTTARKTTDRKKASAARSPARKR